MTKFILIDHSLKDLGGHYYTYACCVLAAAERAGFSPAVAMHQQFRDFAALPRSWQAHAVYRRKSYSNRASHGHAVSWWTQLRQALRTRERTRIASDFAADCATLFDRIRLEDDDHVFIATASEIDLEGLSLFLESARAYQRVNWHLQFHIGLFEGRDPDYASQSSARDAMARVFRDALRRVPGHRLNLYCTTEQLTVQYQHMEVALFRTLPYPVHPLFRESPGLRAVIEPVRIACLGHNRREKGYRQLPIILREIWNDYLRIGRAQIVLQTRRHDLRRAINAAVKTLGTHSATPPVEYAAFPLDLEHYAALVRSSDVGLLLYDSARYYARCSGVLLEMLSAGVPVIVPAGCWLAEQIAEENQRYLDSVAASAAVLQRVGSCEISWQSPSSIAIDPPPGGAPRIVSCDRTAAIGEFALPDGATSLLLSSEWLAPQGAGTYLRIVLEQYDAQGQLLSGFVSVTGSRSHDKNVHVLFGLRDGATRVRLTLSNAWDDGLIRLRDIECRLLGGEHRPAGAVGLTAADIDQTPELLLDILQHIGHYRRSAAAFAARCAEYHNADQIIAQLMNAADCSASEHPKAQLLAD